LINSEALDDDDFANPCGAQAVSFFNDTFTLEYDKVPIPIREHGISHPAYTDSVFKTNENNKQWLDVTNGKPSVRPIDLVEHFINWINFATVPNWVKLWGVIEQDMIPGNYIINIENSSKAHTPITHS